MISYITHVAIACLLIPVTLIMDLWVSHASPQPLIKSLAVLRGTRGSFYSINAFFCISVLVAAIIRYRQMPSIFEIWFIDTLVIMQLCVVITVAIFSMPMAIFKKEPFNLISSWIIGIAQHSVTYSNSISPSAFLIYYTLAKDCHSLRNFADLSVYFSPEYTAKEHAKWIGIAFVIAFGVFMVTFALVAFLGRLFRLYKRPWLRTCPRWLLVYSLKVVATIFLTLNVSVFILMVITLVRQRQTIRETSGENYKDDEWGYGQTTAVLLWTPILWKVIQAVWSMNQTPR
jgi:hypothetical protein